MRATVDGNRWSELYRSLPRPARLAAIGAVVLPASMLLPWYGIQFGAGLSQTGVDAFGMAQLALVLTAAAALYLLFRLASGYRPPRPLSAGGLLAAAGIWAALLVGYAIIDRPDEISGHTHLHLRYGIFVAMGGAIAIAIGGLRLRGHREPTGRRDDAP